MFFADIFKKFNFLLFYPTVQLAEQEISFAYKTHDFVLRHDKLPVTEFHYHTKIMPNEVISHSYEK